jgi:hypothetical protein
MIDDLLGEGEDGDEDDLDAQLARLQRRSSRGIREDSSMPSVVIDEDIR